MSVNKPGVRRAIGSARLFVHRVLKGSAHFVNFAKDKAPEGLGILDLPRWNDSWAWEAPRLWYVGNHSEVRVWTIRF